MASTQKHPVIRSEIGRPTIDPKEKRITISVVIPPALAEEIQAIMEFLGTENRSEAICYAIAKTAERAFKNAK